MKFSKAFATTSIILSFASGGVLAAESPKPVSSAVAPAAAATVAAAPSPASATEVKPLKKRYLLSHSASVYEHPDKASATIAHVRRRAHVNVTGVTGDWLQIRLSSGKVGFIPSSAAE